MFGYFKKAARSLESGFGTAFSSPPASHTAFLNTPLRISGVPVRLGAVIAEGGYSFIHVASPDGAHPGARTTRYAVKRLCVGDDDARRVARAEIDMLETIPPHPNIVRYHGALQRADFAFLLFDLVDGGTLPERLSRTSRPAAGAQAAGAATAATAATAAAAAAHGTHHVPDDAVCILADVAAALNHCHTLDAGGVAVRDVKLENVLYNRLEKRYELCDFGSASRRGVVRPRDRAAILAAEEDVAANCTAMYRAPEQADVYAGHAQSERVDVWALGCVWHAVLYGSLPFDGQSSLAVRNGLRRDRLPQLPLRPGASPPPGAVDLLLAMLAVDPAKRPDAFAVLCAARRMQGLPPPEQAVVDAAHRLRAQRARDFGCAQEFPDVDAIAAGAGGASPVSTPVSGVPVPTAVPTVAPAGVDGGHDLLGTRTPPAMHSGANAQRSPVRQTGHSAMQAAARSPVRQAARSATQSPAQSGVRAPARRPLTWGGAAQAAGGAQMKSAGGWSGDLGDEDWGEPLFQSAPVVKLGRRASTAGAGTRPGAKAAEVSKDGQSLIDLSDFASGDVGSKARTATGPALERDTRSGGDLLDLF